MDGVTQLYKMVLPDFQIKHKISAVRHYYQCGNRAAETCRRVAEEFGCKKVQSKCISKLIAKFEASGSLKDAPRSGRPKTATGCDQEEELSRSLLQSPQKSSRRLSIELGISQSSVMRLMRAKKLYLYIPRLFHALHDGDTDRRVELAEDINALIEIDESFLDKIWWSDEAMFKLNGRINRHNCVYWAASNPRIIIEREVNLPGVTVWCAMSSKGIIGPYFFDDTVNGENYLEMLQNYFWPKVKHNKDCFYQQDGASAHYTKIVRKWLDDKFEDRWVGRRGPVEWPARSPDLTPLDFFFWGVLKDLVYSEKPDTIRTLKRAITEKVQLINQDKELCKEVCRSVGDRLTKCINHKGVQIEQF